jgi:hypothetical protein
VVRCRTFMSAAAAAATAADLEQALVVAGAQPLRS